MKGSPQLLTMTGSVQLLHCSTHRVRVLDHADYLTYVHNTGPPPHLLALSQ